MKRNILNIKNNVFINNIAIITKVLYTFIKIIKHILIMEGSI